MKTILALGVVFLFLHCQSYSVRKFDVLTTTKDGKVIYQIDATEHRFLIQKIEVTGLICVANNEGDLICR